MRTREYDRGRTKRGNFLLESKTLSCSLNCPLSFLIKARFFRKGKVSAILDLQEKIDILRGSCLSLGLTRPEGKGERWAAKRLTRFEGICQP